MDNLKMSIEKPHIGDIRTGRSLGYRNTCPHIWQACIDCGKERWVTLERSIPQSIRCPKCRIKSMRGSNSPSWKGGRRICPDGYVLIMIQPDDPYYCMSDHGEIYEHRYIMAKKLGRPLELWEIVHHKGTKYPMGDKENKSDNREENLELTTSDENIVISLMAERIKELEAKLEKLKEKQDGC